MESDALKRRGGGSVLWAGIETRSKVEMEGH